MASRRATRSRSGEDNGGGPEDVEEELIKWTKVADMIGETLEYVCNMGQQERNQLMLLLPADDGDGKEDANDKVATIDELLDSDDDDQNKTGKRPRSSDTEIEELKELSKKPKIGEQSGGGSVLSSKSEDSANVITPDKNQTIAQISSALGDSGHPSTPKRQDFNKCVKVTASGSELTIKSPSTPKLISNIQNILTRLEIPKLVGNAESSDEGLRSPIIKGRTKKESARSQETVNIKDIDVENYDQLESDSEEGLNLRLDESQDLLTEKLEDSQNLLENNVSTTVPETPDSSQISVPDFPSGIENEATMNDYEENTDAINKLLDADTLDIETATEPNAANPDPGTIFEVSNKLKNIQKAVIGKIIGWNDYYKFNDVSFVKQSIPSDQECFEIMEEHPEMYKFTKVSEDVNFEKETSVYFEDVKKIFSTIKYIKSQGIIHNGPTLVTVGSVKWGGGFGVVKEEIKPGTSGLEKANKYLSTRSKTRTRVQENVGEEYNIEVDDSSDDFEDSKGVEDGDWHPGEEKAKTGRPRNPSDGKSRHPSDGKTRKPSGGNTRKLRTKTELECMEDSPLEANEGNGVKWLGKEPKGKGKGKGMQGRKNVGDGVGRGKTVVSDQDNLNDVCETQSSKISFLDRGLNKAKLLIDVPESTTRTVVYKPEAIKSTDDYNKEKEKRINEKINNPISAATTSRNFAGERSRSQDDNQSDDDEIKVVGVVPSPAAKRLGSGRNDLNRRHSSQEHVRRPSGDRSISEDSFEKLSRMDVSVTRSNSMDAAAGDSQGGMADIEVKEEALGECPLCEQKFWMTELEHHAAECQGGASQDVEKCEVCRICFQMIPVSKFRTHCRGCQQEQKKRNRT